jgi:uncharacterized membrane protein
MKKRPLPVTIISWLLIATGALGLIFHITQVKRWQPFPQDIIWIVIVEVIAIAGGAHMLRGKDWARWLAIAWIGLHVVISVFNSWQEVVVHSLLLALFAYFLFRTDARQYFRGQASPGTNIVSGV